MEDAISSIINKLKPTHRTVSEDTTIGRESLPISEMLAAYETDSAGRYDWESQTAFPVMERELEKVKGGSETETRVTDLRDIPMSPQDFLQYYDHFSSENAGRRLNDRPHSMIVLAKCLKGMGTSLVNEDEIGYYEARNHFLENDSYYRGIDRDMEREMCSESPSAPSAGLDSLGECYQSSYAERIRYTPTLESNRWSGERGESVCAPQSDAARQILKEHGMDGVQYHNGIPDFSPFSEATVMLGYMTDARHSQGVSGRDGKNMIYAHFEDGKLISQSHRADKNLMGDLHMKYAKPGNFEQADILAAEQWTANGRDGKKWTADDVAQYRQDHGLTWHECNDMETMQMIPEAINADFGHFGGVAEVKRIQRIVDEVLREDDEGQILEDEDYDKMSPEELKIAAQEEGHYSDEGIWIPDELSVEHEMSEHSEPEMNMAPSASTDYGVSEHTEPEMNMAPSGFVERGVSERTEPEMNMAPSGFVEREAPVHHSMSNMNQQASTQIKPDNNHNTNDEAQSVGESAMQDLGISW